MSISNLFTTKTHAGELYRDGEIEDHPDAHCYVCDAGRRWVGKPCSQNNFFAEAMASLFGEALAAPMPASSIGAYKGVDVWLSEWVPLIGHWEFDAGTTYQVSNIEQFGRVIATDVLLCNEDRHAKNVLVREKAGDGYEALAIDFGKAKLAMPGVFDPDSGVAVSGVYETIPRRYVEEEAMEASRMLQNMSDVTIRRIVNGAAATAGLESVAATAYDLCMERLELLPGLTLDFVSQLP